jgi:hypothetical protein
MKRRTHLDDNLGALSVRLGAEELAGLRGLVETIGVQGERYPPAMMRALDG